MEHKQISSILKTASIVTLITILSKCVGIFRDMLMVWTFGTSAEADAYNMAQGVAGVVISLVITTISTTGLPLYSELKLNRHSKAGNDFLNNLLNILLIISVGICLVATWFAEPITRLFAGGFTGERFALTVSMFRMIIIAVFFNVATGIFTTYLQSERKLSQLTFISSLGNIFLISGILMGWYFGAIWLALGFVLSIAISALMQGVLAYRLGFKWRPYLNFRDPALKRIAKMMLPVWLGQFVAILGTMVDKSLASYLTEGSVSALNYALRLVGSINTLIVPTILAIIAPIFAEDAVRSPGQLGIAYSQAMRTILLICLPMLIGVIALAEPMVRILFGFGSFGEWAISETIICLALYAPQILLFSVIGDATSRAFVSLYDTLTPLKISIVATLIDIIMNYALVGYLGLSGLALSTTIGGFCYALGSMWLLKKRLGSISGKSLVRTSLWVLAASLLMVLPLLWLNSFIFTLVVQRIYRLLILALEVVVGIFIYFTVINFSKIPEVEQLKQFVLQKIRPAHSV